MKSIIREHVKVKPGVSGLGGREIGELFRARSVSQERRGLRDRLSDDRNAQDLFEGLLGKWYD